MAKTYRVDADNHCEVDAVIAEANDGDRVTFMRAGRAVPAEPEIALAVERLNKIAPHGTSYRVEPLSGGPDVREL